MPSNLRVARFIREIGSARSGILDPITLVGCENSRQLDEGRAESLIVELEHELITTSG
jgi:hypothetical protein